MSELNLDEIRARWAATTGGQWELTDECVPSTNKYLLGSGAGIDAACYNGVLYYEHIIAGGKHAGILRQADADALVNAPTDVHALLALVAHLTVCVAELETKNAQLHKNVADAEEQWSDQQGELTYLRGENVRMSQELRERRDHDASLLDAALARQRNLNKPEVAP